MYDAAMPESTAAAELLSTESDPGRSGPTLDELLARCTPEAAAPLLRRVGLDGEGPGAVPGTRFSSAI
jgi:hypothetical protein